MSVEFVIYYYVYLIFVLAEVVTMRMLLCSVVFYVALFCGATQGEVFTALADLENVLWAEKELASQLRGYIEQQEERINYLKK